MSERRACVWSCHQRYLSEGEGYGVLRVRASDLDDVFELVRLGGQGVMELLQAGQQHLVDLRGRGDVHGCWEGVVGALKTDTTDGTIKSP